MPDGRLLCTGSDDCGVLVWSVEAVTSLARASGEPPRITPPGYPCSAAPHPPGGASLGPTGAASPRPGSSGASLVSPRPGRAAASPRPGATATGSLGGSAAAVTSSTGGGAAAAAARAGGVAPAAAARCLQKALRRHHRPVLALAASPDSKFLVSASADKTVRGAAGESCLALLYSSQ
jgi:WD40 repeat protein